MYLNSMCQIKVGCTQRGIQSKFSNFTDSNNLDLCFKRTNINHKNLNIFSFILPSLSSLQLPRESSTFFPGSINPVLSIALM